MIECKKVSFSYPPNETDIGDREGHGTLRNIDLSINDGDFVLLCGTSGCGKTTLTRLFNGLIPHYYDGIGVKIGRWLVQNKYIRFHSGGRSTGDFLLFPTGKGENTSVQ